MVLFFIEDCIYVLLIPKKPLTCTTFPPRGMRVAVLCGVVAVLVAAASTSGAAVPKARDTEVIDGHSKYPTDPQDTVKLVESNSAVKVLRLYNNVTLKKKKSIWIEFISG